LKTPLFETTDLSFNTIIQYPDIFVLPDNPTFFVGESGSGKTSLFRMFNRTLSPDSGNITFRGRDITTYDPITLRRQVMLVSQSVFLFDQTIKENYKQFYAFAGIPLISDDEINHYLNLCHIPITLESDCRILSGGERQRIYLSIFMSFKPDVLLLDEPTSALDQENTKIVMENIIQFCGENAITPLIISHDPHAIDAYANTIVRLS